ncbi:hypothetical protein BGZ88_005773 [Linnemannia elongata]|nr:hypothetical protein BGZ88_005773 [Linnemannia elongata]
MYIGYLEAPTQGNPELSEEVNTALRLKRAQRAIEPVDVHYRRRLAFNIARLSVVEQSVTILDGPALSPDSKLTGDDSETPGLPPQAAICPPAEDCPGFQPGLALTVGLFPIVGPCISLWLSHKMVCSKLSDLKLSHERQTELQQMMVATMCQDFLLRLCLPLVGPVISHYAQPHHAILKHADELVSAQTEQIQQRFDRLVHETLAEHELSLEQWESYKAVRLHNAAAAAAAPPSFAPPAIEWVILDSEEAMRLEFIEPTVPEASLESADSAAELYFVQVQLGGADVASAPVLGAQVGASSAPGEHVDAGRLVTDDVSSWCSSEYSFSVHRESSILDETTSVAGEGAETQSSSSAIVVSAEQTPRPHNMPVDPIADAAAMDVSTPMNRKIPLIYRDVPDITHTTTLSPAPVVNLHDSSSTVAMPSYLEALLVYWPLIQHSVPQQNDDEETIPTMVLRVHRVIIDIPEMATIAVASRSSSTVPDTSSSAVPASVFPATPGPGIISASANASEVSDTPQSQASEDEAFAETDLAFTSQYNTPISDSSILPTSQSNFESVEVTFSSSSSTLLLSTTPSPSLSEQERTNVTRLTMTTTIEHPEGLPTRFRDLSIHMLEAGPTRVNSPSTSEDDDSPAATIAALPTESQTASISSTSPSTLSETSTPAPRSRPSHLQVPPTFTTAGRFQFSSSNEVSSEEEGYDSDFGREEADDDVANQEEDCSDERNQVDATLVDSSHNQQQGIQSQASAVGSEDHDVARDESGFKNVRPMLRLRPGYRLRSLSHEDLFVGFDSVSFRLDDYDRNYRPWRVTGMSEPQERGETQLDSFALRFSSSTTRGHLHVTNPNPRSDLELSRQRHQDANAATLDVAFVDRELSRYPATTPTGLSRGGFDLQRDVSQPPRTADMQGFVGAAMDKAVIEEEGEQDNDWDVETQALAIEGQWKSIRGRTQHPATITATQDRIESVFPFPFPLHPPPIPPRPPHRPLSLIRMMSPGRDSMPSTSSSAPPQLPQQQQPSTQPQQQPRSFTDQPLNKQQPLLQQHIQSPFEQKSLRVGGAPTYHSYPTIISTGIHINEISVPLGSMDTYAANNEPPTSTATASKATNTGTGAGAGEDWSPNPTPPTEQATSLLLCAPFVPKFDDSDDDKIPPVVAVRVPNSRSGLRLPFQNQTSHQGMFEGQQRIPARTVPWMSQSLYHDAIVPQSATTIGAAGATGAIFGLVGGGRITEEAIENEFSQISEPTLIFGQRLIEQHIGAVRSWRARHEQDQMFTSRNNVNSYASESSFSSAQQQQQQPLENQPQQQVLTQQQHWVHHHLQLQQPLQPQHQPKYQEEPQGQERTYLPTGGQQRTWLQTTYDPTEDLDGDNGTDADAAFLSARQFQDPRFFQQQQQHYLHQRQSAINTSGGNQYIGGLLAPLHQPWLTSQTSLSQYLNSRAIHPRLLLQQQQQTHHPQQQILPQQQRQLQQQYMLLNQSGFNFGRHPQHHHQHQHTYTNPSQTHNR